MLNTLRRPRIAFFTINDPRDKRSWSGVTYYMGQSMLKNVGDVEFLGPVRIPFLLDKILRAIQKITRLFFKTEYLPKYSLLKNNYAAWTLGRKLKKGKFDFVFGPAAASELACLHTHLPIVYFGDATYKIYRAMYKKEFLHLNSLSELEGNYLEKRALQRSKLVIFSSPWAAASAVDDYNVPESKIAVMHLGANVDQVFPRDRICEKEKNPTLTLLFLSVDWERKGGDIAFDTFNRLLESGVDTRLIICGCLPPVGVKHPKMEIIPFLNKNDSLDFKRFVTIFSSVHFLLLPTRADCTPLVNCEANSYGVPVITTDVGGITHAVKNGVNGYCLTLDATAGDFADLVAEIYADKKRYHDLIISSRRRFDESLNWDCFAENLKQTLQQHGIFKFS